MHLKKEERQILWKKYKNSGLTSYQANIRLNEFINYLNNLIIELKAQKKSKEHIEQEFRKNFEEMCMKIDGMQ